MNGADRARAPRTRRPTADDGFVVVDKPQGWTSHDVVARMRHLAGTRKVGHAGTLDPMATGVLVLGIGRATRLLTYVVGADKEYVATIRLGQSTTTDDAEGEPVRSADASALTVGRVRSAVEPLTGPIQQVPSAVSAIKIDGKRAYARVRAGEHVELPPRPVTVSRFEVHGVRTEVADDGTVVLDVDVTVVCSSGTYIRALARDLGAALGVGGHLTALRRTRVGGYVLAEAADLDALAATPEDVPLAVLGLADAARATFPVRELTPAEARALSYGQRIAWAPGRDETVGRDETAARDETTAAGRDEAAGEDEVPAGDQGVDRGAAPRADLPVAALAPDGSLVALVGRRGGYAVPELVLAPA